MGLLVKGGVFVSGLWLPLTHSEAETPVSAIMSGVVVKAGVYPLLRCALMVEEIEPMVRIFGVATTLLGVTYAVFEKDTKRMLAFHTVSQLGFIMAAPAVGGFYALAHGLVKSTLFLLAGALPSRSFKDLQQKTMPNSIWVALVLASLSISGFPLLAGFGAKVLTFKNMLPWQSILMNLAAVGTAISFAKFIFLPHGSQDGKLEPAKGMSWGFWPAVLLLISELIVANVVFLPAYTLDNILKAVLTIGIGWLIYWFVTRSISIKLPRQLEAFDSLIGWMILILLPLFWMAFTGMEFV